MNSPTAQGEAHENCLRLKRSGLRVRLLTFQIPRVDLVARENCAEIDGLAKQPVHGLHQRHNSERSPHVGCAENSLRYHADGSVPAQELFRVWYLRPFWGCGAAAAALKSQKQES